MAVEDSDDSNGESPERNVQFRSRVHQMSDESPATVLRNISSRLNTIQIRDWNEFSQITAFSIPKITVDALQRRLVLNGLYFQANYAMIFLTGIFFVCIARPMFAVALFVFAAFFIYMKCHYAHLPGISIEKLQATVATVALILFLYFGGTSLWSALVLSLFATAVHAVFYVPKMKSTTIGVKELWKNSDSVFAKFGDPVFDVENPNVGESPFPAFNKGGELFKRV